MPSCSPAPIALLLLLSACATTEPGAVRPTADHPRLANLRRAAALPWRDEGRCVVQEASHPWPVVVERCFQVLDTRRVQFHDAERRCPVAIVGAAAVPAMVGICLLSQPYIAVGAVVILGAVVVAVAIHEELEAYELRKRLPEDEDTTPGTEARPVPREPLAERGPEPEASSSGRDRPPPITPGLTEPERRPECTPKRVRPKGGNALHNRCADNVPFNAFRGANAMVNGKAFDALQPATRTLWEVKTTAIETYKAFVQRTELDKQITEGRRERDLAAACGYDFVIGVRTEAHKTLLERADITLKVVVMDWC